jgi:UDP-glucose 4-epimerase
MRIVVTGGCGFIGSHLVDKLAGLDLGEIVVFDNCERSGLAPRHWPRGVSLCCGDVEHRGMLERVMRGCDLVFHLAAQSRVLAGVRDACRTFRSNVIGTFNALEAAKCAGVRRFVFTSSREVYGNVDRLPVHESSPLRPVNAYGAGKVAGEVYCNLAIQEGIEAVVLRLSNVYGPRDCERVIPMFIEAALSAVPLTVHGSSKLLDFVWVHAVVDAIVQAGIGPWIRTPTNIGSGKGVTLLDLARRIVALSGSSSPVHIGDARRCEVDRFVADIRQGIETLNLDVPDDPLAHLPEMIRLYATADERVRAGPAA